MTAVSKSKTQATRTLHPARPQGGKLNVAAAHKKIAKRFPKVLAELAK